MEKDSIKQFLAALFFIICCALVAIFIFTIGQNKGFSQPKFKIAVLFKNVGGLAEGAPARLSGVNIGIVNSIEFLEKGIEGRRVKVILDIYSRYKNQLKTATSIAIETEGVLGEKLVEIYADENEKPVDFKEAIIGQDPLDAGDIAEAFVGAAESFRKTAEELSQIDMVELSKVMEDSSRALLQTADGFNEIMFELEEISIKSKRLIDRLEQKVIEGNLFKVF